MYDTENTIYIYIHDHDKYDKYCICTLWIQPYLLRKCLGYDLGASLLEMAMLAELAHFRGKTKASLFLK